MPNQAAIPKETTMNVGAKAPDFALRDENGQLRHLHDFLEDGPAVLFFYPAAMTSGCTAEACHFRDLASEYRDAGAQRIGISLDPVSRQKEFSEKHSFDYPLLSDEDGTVARQFGVKRGLLAKLAPVHRKTFVIGQDRTILEIIKSETRMNAHADRALEVLAARQSGA
jgi:thioredoxin-dependent peroxiredoxin